MAFQLEGITSKPEAVRGILNTLVFWPRQDGKLVVPSAPAILGLFDPAGGSVVGFGAPAVQGNGSITFTWTPGGTALLAEDYRYEISWTDPAGAVHYDKVYFDLVRYPLSCPIDQNHLLALEGNLSKWLTAAGITDAQQFIQRAWDEIVARIRGQGYRPALLTDRSAFVSPAIYLGLSKAFTSLFRESGDVYDSKRQLYEEEYKKAWAQLGALKFEDPQQFGFVAGRRTPAQPRFKV